MTPETRAQCEDAIRVLDAVIAARDAYEKFIRAHVKGGRRLSRCDAEGALILADEHAQHQIEMYRARYAP